MSIFILVSVVIVTLSVLMGYFNQSCNSRLLNALKSLVMSTLLVVNFLTITFIVGGIYQLNEEEVPYTPTKVEQPLPKPIKQPTIAEQQAKLTNGIVKKYKNINRVQAKRLVKLVYKYSTKHNLKPTLVLGVIATESSFNRIAVSPSGAIGYTQVLPQWHQDKIAGRDISDPEVNIQVGTRILKDCLKKRKSVEGALACYNGSYKKPQGKTYASKVLANKKQLVALLV